MYVVLIFSSAPNALGTGSMASAKRECCGLSLVYYRLCSAFFRNKKKIREKKTTPVILNWKMHQIWCLSKTELPITTCSDLC